MTETPKKGKVVKGYPKPTFVRFNVMDIDGRHFQFDHQQKGWSCVPAAVKIAKECFHNQIIGEDALRGVATLFGQDEEDARQRDLLAERETVNAERRAKGLPPLVVGSLEAIRANEELWRPLKQLWALPHGRTPVNPVKPKHYTVTSSPLDGHIQSRTVHDWEKEGLNGALILDMLRAQPLPISSARAAHASVQLLKAANRNRPVVITWRLPGGGGYHGTVCVGPTRTNSNLVVILDPGTGLRYVDLTDTIPGGFFKYRPMDPRAIDPRCPKGADRYPPYTHRPGDSDTCYAT